MSIINDGSPGVWADKTAFVMPLIPEELHIDPLFAGLLHCMAFLELSGDNDVDPDWAIEAMEHVSVYLQRLPHERQLDIASQLDRLAGWATASGQPKFASYSREFLLSVNVGDSQGTV